MTPSPRRCKFDDVVDAIDHVILCRKWPWQPSARWWRGSSPAGRAFVAGGAARLEAPGRSFHIDGSSSKWISAEFATRPSKEKPMRICIFGVGAIGGYIAGNPGVPGLDVASHAGPSRRDSRSRPAGP